MDKSGCIRSSDLAAAHATLTVSESSTESRRGIRVRLERSRAQSRARLETRLRPSVQRVLHEVRASRTRPGDPHAFGGTHQSFPLSGMASTRACPHGTAGSPRHSDRSRRLRITSLLSPTRDPERSEPSRYRIESKRGVGLHKKRQVRAVGIPAEPLGYKVTSPDSYDNKPFRFQEVHQLCRRVQTITRLSWVRHPSR